VTQLRKTPYVSANLTVPARAALQSAAVTVSAAAGKRVSQSAALLAALAVAERHMPEVVEQLRQNEQTQTEEDQ
jgi:hypothetical protein